jgi:hypothetical protein
MPRLLLIAIISCAFGAWAAESAVAVFPDLATARAEFVDDHLEPYFSTLQPLEMAAKTGAAMTPGTVEQQRDECRRRYQAAVLAYTPEEQGTLTWYSTRMRDLVAKDYPLVAQAPWRYLKVAGSIEGGLPHTRGECVVFAPEFVDQLAQARTGMAEAEALQALGDTVLHEHMHVVQRLHPKVFAGLYTGLWHLRRAPRIADCPWLVEHHLANPDGVDCPWVFPIATDGATRWIWPLVVFGEVQGIGRMPDDFIMAAVSVTEAPDGFTVVRAADGRPEYADLMTVREYAGLYAGSSNIYHPNESAADLFAKVVLFDAFADRTRIPAARLTAIEQRLGPLRAWFKANLVIHP